MRYDEPDIDLRTQRDKVARDAKYPDEFRDPRQRLVLLIHGYNVNEIEAFATLNKFRDALAYYAPQLLNDTFTLAWPGNWTTPLVKLAAYPQAYRNAKEAAKTLFEGIQKWYARRAPPELVIVAHSLGCRLVLETLRLLGAAGKPNGLERLIVVLMAAAVPVQHLAPGGCLYPTLQAANAMIVLYSETDYVLATGFRAGQSLVLDGILPEAVGQRANPPGTPWTEKRRMLAFGHGDYWNELETADVVCRAIGVARRTSDIGVPLVTRKQLAAHQLPMVPLLASG